MGNNLFSILSKTPTAKYSQWPQPQMPSSKVDPFVISSSLPCETVHAAFSNELYTQIRIIKTGTDNS